jgi:hypothetical protein
LEQRRESVRVLRGNEREKERGKGKLEERRGDGQKIEGARGGLWLRAFEADIDRMRASECEIYMHH